jgi:hypothetical protein
VTNVGGENIATKPAQPEKKKRGRKRKSDLSAEIRNSLQVETVEEPEIRAEPTSPIAEKKITRSGRISKPRPRDLDMVNSLHFKIRKKKAELLIYQ